MRHEPTSSQTSAGALLQQHAAISVEEIDHGIQTLKHLIDRLEGLKKETESFTAGHTADLRLPQEVVLFHARKEIVQAERQIREAVGVIFGKHSPEFRKHQHLRISLGSKTGIPDALRVLRDLTFHLEGKTSSHGGTDASGRLHFGHRSAHRSLYSPAAQSLLRP
jgi:hypothetical protein